MATEFFKEKDICPETCCKEKKCVLSNNFNINATFVKSNETGSESRFNLSYKKGEMIYLKVDFQNRTEELFKSDDI